MDYIKYYKEQRESALEGAKTEEQKEFKKKFYDNCLKQIKQVKKINKIKEI